MTTLLSLPLLTIFTLLMGTKEIREMFGDTLFDFAKPSEFVGRLIEQVAEKDDLVLDFFAGSGSTGAAVCNLRLTDEPTSYKFILVQQIPEKTEIGSIAKGNGYATISDITIKRV